MASFTTTGKREGSSVARDSHRAVHSAKEEQRAVQVARGHKCHLMLGDRLNAQSLDGA